MAATLRIDGPPITADHESTQIETVIIIDEEGNHSVALNCRRTGSSRIYDTLIFDAYEWERLKKAIADIDSQVAHIQERGALFRMG